MGLFFGRTADVTFLVLTCWAQWQLARAVLGEASRLQWPLAAVRGALGMLSLLLAMGVISSLPAVGGWLPLNYQVAGGLRAVTFLWLVGSTGAWMIHCLFQWMRRPPGSFDPSRRRLLTSAGAASLVPGAILGWGTFIERTNLRTREVEIPVPGLPADLEGLRLAQVSDIHLSAFLSEKEFARMVDATNELRPHVTLVTGDLISMRGDPLDACLDQIARLRADAGVLGCLGNHEIYARAEEYATVQAARSGIAFLRSRARRLRFGGATLNIAGVDYQRMNAKEQYLHGADRLLAPGAVNVLLSHNPDVFPVAATQGWDLTLSGHTHGGQITVEILDQALNVARFFTHYVYGLYRSGRSSIYVTRGIGTIALPVRIGAPPEIALLRLKKA